MKSQATLVDVGALRVRPSRVRRRHIQQRSAIHVRSGKVALRTNAVDRIPVRVAPPAAHASQAGRALRMRLTRLALVRFSRRLVGRRGGAVEPLATEPELVFTGVDTEAEALARGLAPDAAAALVQAVLAVEAHAAGRRALAGVGDGAAGAPAPRAPRLVRPPLAVVAGHAALAADVVGAVGARRRLQREVPPLSLGRADDHLVGVPELAAVC